MPVESSRPFTLDNEKPKLPQAMGLSHDEMRAIHRIIVEVNDPVVCEEDGDNPSDIFERLGRRLNAKDDPEIKRLMYATYMATLSMMVPRESLSRLEK